MQANTPPNPISAAMRTLCDVVNRPEIMASELERHRAAELGESALPKLEALESAAKETAGQLEAWAEFHELANLESVDGEEQRRHQRTAACFRHYAELLRAATR